MPRLTIQAAFSKKFKTEMDKYGGRLSNQLTQFRRAQAEAAIGRLMKQRLCEHDWKSSFARPLPFSDVRFYRCALCKFTVAANE